MHNTLRRPYLLGAALALLTLAAACGNGAQATDATPGSPSTGNAPVFSGETFNHGPFDLADKRGKPVVINFWFPSCPPCAAELPDLQAAYEKYNPQGVEFVGIQQLGLDSAVAGKKFLADKGITFPSLPDDNSKIQTAYRVLGYPTTVFLDRDHNIVRKWDGLIDAGNLDKNIQALLKS